MQVGDLVLVSYVVRPPSKLAARWAGPFRVLKVDGNRITIEDLTDGSTRTVDISRLKIFRGDADPQKIAAADLGESTAIRIDAFKGQPKKRSSLRFQVVWSDGDITWEPWQNIKKLALLEDFVAKTPALRYLKSK